MTVCGEKAGKIKESGAEHAGGLNLETTIPLY